MDRDRIDDIFEDPDMIFGIHNYCDRWCERCPKTSRCTVFAMEEAENADAESHDAENEAFWDKLQETFDLTLETARDWMDENDIEIDEAAYEASLALREHVDDYTEDHPIMKAAGVYRQQVHEWFRANEATFKHISEDLRQAYELDLPDTDPKADLWERSDLIEVILWYHTLILAKLHRAVHQVIERDLTGEDDETGDSDGSAKIALISMDRSLYAWNVLRKHLSGHENDIGSFLARLEKLRRQTEVVFPNARAFIRPGLDE